MMETKTLIGLFVEQTRNHEAKRLYRYKKGDRWVSVTWAEEFERVKEFTLGLLDCGLTRGDRVCILSHTRPDWLTLDVSIQAAGGAVVGIYPTMTGPQMAYIINHCEARVLVVENLELLDRVHEVRSEIKSLERIFVIDGEPPDISRMEHTLSWLLDRGREKAAREPDLFDRSVRAVKPEDLCSICYTSGTTGPPKGAMITHRNFFSVAKNTASIHPFDDHDFGVAFLPMAHVLQRVASYAALCIAAEGAYAESIDKLLENFAELRPTVQPSVPRIWEKAYTKIHSEVEKAPARRRKIFQWCMGVGKRASVYRKQGRRLPPRLALQYRLARRLVFRRILGVFGGRIKYLVSGGAPISVEILEFFYDVGLLILEGYGLTETAAPATFNRVDDFKFGTVGKPIPGTEIKIAPDGEILIRGSGVFKGYYKEEEATREAIDADGWFHSGDIGEFDRDGFLKITDRKKDLIITSGGKNVSPQNIENLLRSIPIVSQAMVYGDRRKYLTALITIDEEELASMAVVLGIAAEGTEGLKTHPRTQEWLAKAIGDVNRELASFETIKKFRILDHDLSEKEGELTPTLKVKRKEVIRRHKELLDSMYEEHFD
ncbi:AMP-dependent synthetase/ligase [Thermodesulfobacteriota bacterium]